MTSLLRSALALAFVLGHFSPVLAQETTGSISGSVLDPSGAPVPNATVNLREAQTGFARVVRSSNDGNFQAPLLPPGQYELTVQQPGFSLFRRTGVVVSVTERIFVECKLSVEAVEQSVSVTDTIPLVQSESATQGRVISGSTLRSLPLATRNYTQLLALTAGVSQALTNADTVGLGNVNPNVNGLRAGSNNILMDGLTAHGALNNSPANIGSPALDFLAEFKVLTSMFAAEYGKQAGSVVNVVTRSGDNDLHASFWEFFRNTKLNARNFFGTRRGQNNQNQFGFTVGGPVILPRLYNGKNRTFFFAGYEGLRQRNANSTAAINSYSLPSADNRAGRFTTPIRDPLTGLPCSAADSRGCFPNNTIPANRINPISRNIMEAFIPLPNVVTGTAINYIRSGNLKGENNQYFLRGDHAFSDRQRINVRYFRSPAETENPGALPGLAAASVTGKWDLGLTATQLITPNQFNELRLGWARNLSIGGNANLNTTDPRSLGIPATNDLPGIPVININGVVNFGRDQYFRDNVHSYTLSDNFTSIRGRHTMKFGVELRQARMQASNTLTNRPRWVFSGQSTTNSFADFLLSLPSQGTYGTGSGVVNLLNFATNLFVQDDFKVNRHLTLNVGLRYEYNSPPIEAQKTFIGFWPDRYTGPGSPESAGIITAGVNGVPKSTVFAPRTNFAPRFGFAYAPGQSGRLAIRGGFGIYYDQAAGQVAQQYFNNPPVLAQRNIVFPVTGVPDGYVYRVEGLDPNVLPVPTATSNITLTALEKNPRNDTVKQWNLDLQRQLPGNVVLQAAYVGTHGTHLFIARNINFPRPGADGVFRRPFVGFGPIRYMANNGNSIYHSGQFTVNKRFARNAQILAAYTFSKAIDDAAGTDRYFVNGAGNPLDFRSNRGPATFDRPHRLTTSFNLEIPNPWQAARVLLGGWQFAGVAVLQSGTPFEITNNQSALDLDGDMGSAGTGGRADYVGGNIYTAGGTMDRIRGWLNRDAFARAPRTRYGNLGRGVARGPSHGNIDVAIDKQFPLGERFRLSFRSEAFNLLNNPNFSNPSGNLDAPNFGVVSSTVNNARIIQFALKLQF